MYPTISPGDYIVIEQVKNEKAIKYGRAYVIVAKDGYLIKRIHSHKNPQKFILKSDNFIYEPYEIRKEDIISIWRIKNYLLRTNLAPTNPFMYAANIFREEKNF